VCVFLSDLPRLLRIHGSLINLLLCIFSEILARLNVVLNPIHQLALFAVVAVSILLLLLGVVAVSMLYPFFIMVVVWLLLLQSVFKRTLVVWIFVGGLCVIERVMIKFPMCIFKIFTAELDERVRV
jgi:hypothetical protein